MTTTILAPRDVTPLDELLATIAETEATIAKHLVHVEIADTSDMPDHLRDQFIGFFMEHEGRPLILVPAGQPPQQRLEFLREVLRRSGRIA